MERIHTLDIDSPSLSFSSGHFTIFNRTERENVHGHDYQLAATLTTRVGDTGISFDYRDYKKKMKALCEKVNTRCILPSENPFLHIASETDAITAYFSDEKLTFLPRDVVILPLRNSTLEELSHWFLTEFVQQHRAQLVLDKVDAIHMRLSTRPGQTGTSFWEAKK